MRCSFSNLARRAVVGLVILGTLAFTPSLALAAKKKKAEEEEAAPVKSYVLPYMIVIFMLSGGVMALGRPSKRADKPAERAIEEDD